MFKLIINKIDCNSCILNTGEVVQFTMPWYNQLLSEIKSWRLEKSHIINLPPYCVFPDKTLHSIINVLPTTTEHLWLVSGFNEVLINNYGDDIIHIIKSFLNDKDIIEIIYSTNSFDLKNHKVKGILGFLGYLPLFNKEPQIIEEQDISNKLTKNANSKKDCYIPKYANVDYFPDLPSAYFIAPDFVELYDIFKVQFEDGDVLEAQIVEPVEITVFEETGRRDGSSKFYRKKVRMLNPENCYSADTPFAKAVINKRLNQEFSYKIENILIKGTIINIQKANKKEL